MDTQIRQQNFGKPLSAPSIIRLARRAGVKSMTKDCLETIRGIIDEKVAGIIEQTLIVNLVKNNRTDKDGAPKGKILMVDDVYTALTLMGKNVARSDN